MHKNRHKYDYDSLVNGNNSAAHILSMVSKGGTLLEIGAGQGSISKPLIDIAKCRVSAIEIDDNSIEKLKEFCHEVKKVDLNSDNWPKVFNEKFDTIVAADVLEHLYNPLDVLINTKKLLKESGYIIVSLPHIGHNGVHAALIDNDFSYSETGLLDFTHIRFFGINNMQRLFDDAGLFIKDVKFVVRHPKDTEFSEKWEKLPNNIKSILELNKYGNVYQCVIKASSKNSKPHNNRICSYSINSPDMSIARIINRITKKYLPSHINLYLRKIYIKFLSK